MSRGCGVLRLARATVQQSIFTSCISGLPTFPTSSMDTSRLQYLDLSMASLSPICMELLLSYCSMLKNLSLEMCSVTDSACTAISANTSLSVLHMGQVQGLTTLGISRILSSCTQLVELNLGWTCLSSPAVQAVCSLVQAPLRRLCLSGNRDTLLDSHVEILLDSCPNLRELDVSGTKCGSVLGTVLTLFCRLDQIDCRVSKPDGGQVGLLGVSVNLPLLRHLPLLLPDPLHLPHPPLSQCIRSAEGPCHGGTQTETQRCPRTTSILLKILVFISGIEINKFLFTSIARPTVGIKRTSIWNLRVRE